MTHPDGGTGPRVLVTGAAHGIGRGLAELLAEREHRVIAADVDATALDELEQREPRILALPCDLREVGSFDRMIEAAWAVHGGLEGLVNSAGVIERTVELDDITEDEWDRQLAINLKAPFFLARSYRSIAVRHGRPGSIVLFSSQGWWTGGFAGSVPYSASKGGVVSLTRGLARTFAPDGIRVNCLAPGFIDTAMMAGIDPVPLADLIGQVPLSRLGDPREVARAAAFLVSEEASYITGATLAVTGGQLMY